MGELRGIAKCTFLSHIFLSDGFLTACLFTKLLRRDILVPLRKQSKRGVVAHSLCVPMFVITFPVAETGHWAGLNKTFCIRYHYVWTVCRGLFLFSRTGGGHVLREHTEVNHGEGDVPGQQG